MTSALATELLATQVRQKVRERGLVLWVDAEGQYTGFVDRLAEFPYPIVPFRDSYLELMLALEPYGNDLDPEHVLVHLPRLNKETVKETPVYELYKAGTVFEKALPTLVREAAVGVARPEEVDDFLREGGVTLELADQWLAELREAPRDHLTLLLQSLGLDDVVMAVVTEDPRLRPHLPAGAEQVLAFLEKSIGMDAAWRQYLAGEAELRSDRLAALVAHWLMAVEFANDLRGEEPVTPEMRPLLKLGPVKKECLRLVARLREKHAEQYEMLAADLQERLSEERTSHHAAALGSIDTFRFEESTVRAAALDALCSGEFDAAIGYASERTPEKCFWVRRSTDLQRTWEIIRLGARAGQAISGAAQGLRSCGSLDEAVERYAQKLAVVDRRHRLFEQRTHALLASDLEQYDGLLEARQAVRRAYRDWANAVNRAFFELCAEHGPLPSGSLRQRRVYEDVVHPLIERGGRVALILVDALRFEMAQGVAREIKGQVSLAARLAELPTETAVGMNALAPVERQGRLRTAFRNDAIVGFESGEFSVCDPAARVKAMSHRSLSGTADDIELEEFQDLSLTKLKRRLSSNLVVVRSRELDAAGEHGLHLGTFDQTLTLLKSALSLLQQAGVEHFVITSDHGFLLQDATVQNVPFGKDKRVASRRYALRAEPSGMPDVLEVSLSALEYDCDREWYLVLRPDTALWQTQDKVAPFVHGGNSLQERVIPVLVVERQFTKGKTTSKYEVVARAEPARLGRQRLRVAVRIQGQSELAYHGPKVISLALRIPGRFDVAINLLDAGPPATLENARILVPPNKSEALVEFELVGQTNEKVRVELFHPDAIENVTPKIVEGFFDVGRDRRLGKTAEQSREAVGGWEELIEDPGFRSVLQIVEKQRSINEAEVEQILGSGRRQRAFARQVDGLIRLLPFKVTIEVVGGMTTYLRKD